MLVWGRTEISLFGGSIFRGLTVSFLRHHYILYYIIPQVNSILRNVASKLEYESEQLEDLYERTAWALETRSGLPASSYDLFKKAVV